MSAQPKSLRAPYPMSAAVLLERTKSEERRRARPPGEAPRPFWRQWLDSPAWLICSTFAFWLIGALNPGLLFAGGFGLAFGGLGVSLDRWLRRPRV